MSGHITLTSPVGTFTFDDNVQLSHAKLIRDSVSGQYFNPTGGMRIQNEDDAYKYVKNELDRNLADIKFELFINVDQNRA